MAQNKVPELNKNDPDSLYNWIAYKVSCPEFRNPIKNYIDENCSTFVDIDENSFEQGQLFNEINLLIENLLKDVLEEGQITQEDFLKAAERGMEDKKYKKYFNQIINFGNYTFFKSVMTKRNYQIIQMAEKQMNQENENQSKSLNQEGNQNAPQENDSGQNRNELNPQIVAQMLENEQAELNEAIRQSLEDEEEKRRIAVIEEEEMRRAIKQSLETSKKENEKKKEEEERMKREKEKEQEQAKKEETKKEEPKKEEPKKEEPKKEETKKEDGPKVEEEKKPEKKIPKKPREPEKKEPTDFTELKKELNDIKAAGNELFNNKSYEEAIEKYKEGYEKINNSLSDIIGEKSFNPQSPELLTLSLRIMSNLSLCYTKTEKIEESIDLDLKINSLDKNYDKAYIRLYSNYLKQGKIAQAVYYGDGLLNFDDETKKKYENEVNQINQTKKEYQAQLDAQRAKERKEMIKNIAKYAIPVIILIAAFGVYFYFYKRKRITK